MRILTQADYIWSETQSRYIRLREKSITRTKVALCKGATPQQSSLADSQTAFYNTMTADYSQQFANQNAILSTLSSALNPIIAAGPNQYGYSDAETNVLNAQALQGTGLEYAKASEALGATQASLGGGNTLLPSGVASQQKQQLASAAANQASSELLGIKQAGYQQGYNTYEAALGQLGGVAGMYNPTGYSGAATGAGSSAGTTMNQIAQENQAADPFNAIMGAAGGAASAYLRTL